MDLNQLNTEEKLKLYNDSVNSVRKISKVPLEVSKDEIFDFLKSEQDYWGTNSITEMIDFCKRNKLDWILKPLEKLK